MTRRTYEADANHIETADDLDDLVQDTREGWRASSSKARRRQRRYKKRLTNELLRMDHLDEECNKCGKQNFPTRRISAPTCNIFSRKYCTPV